MDDMLLFRKIIGVILFSALPVIAYTDMSIEELEKQNKLRQAQSILNELEDVGEKVKKEANNQKYLCLKAFGHERFCSCLTGKLPMFLSFKLYLGIVMSEEQQRNSPDVDAETRRTITRVFQVRNECVASSFG